MFSSTNDGYFLHKQKKVITLWLNIGLQQNKTKKVLLEDFLALNNKCTCTLIIRFSFYISMYDAAEAEKNAIGFGSEETEYEDKSMKEYFKPEFRNRLDATITFAKLGKTVMLKIVGKFMKELKDQVKQKDVKFTITDEALDYLVDKGFDPKMGARPLQRVIDKDIKRPLSRALLFGDLKNGGTITIKLVDDKIVLEAEKIAEEV